LQAGELLDSIIAYTWKIRLCLSLVEMDIGISTMFDDISEPPSPLITSITTSYRGYGMVRPLERVQPLPSLHLHLNLP